MPCGLGNREPLGEIVSPVTQDKLKPRVVEMDRPVGRAAPHKHQLSVPVTSGCGCPWPLQPPSACVSEHTRAASVEHGIALARPQSLRSQGSKPLFIVVV
jgi:hypothetical protein